MQQAHWAEFARYVHNQAIYTIICISGMHAKTSVLVANVKQCGWCIQRQHDRAAMEVKTTGNSDTTKMQNQFQGNQVSVQRTTD